MTPREKYIKYIIAACNEMRLDYFPQVEASELLYRVITLEDIYLPLTLGTSSYDVPSLGSDFSNVILFVALMNNGRLRQVLIRRLISKAEENPDDNYVYKKSLQPKKLTSILEQLELSPGLPPQNNEPISSISCWGLREWIKSYAIFQQIWKNENCISCRWIIRGCI